MRIPRFSLKSLLALTAVAAVCILWAQAIYSRAANRDKQPPRRDAVRVTIEPMKESPYASYDGPGIEARMENVQQEMAEQLDMFLEGDVQLLTRVRDLQLSEIQITPEALQRIASLENLERLKLLDCRLPADPFHQLSHASALAELEMNRCQVTDQMLASWKLLPPLKRISLRDNAITSEGINVIDRRPKLQQLDLRGNQVSAAAVSRLRKRMPGCKVRLEE